MRSTVRPPTKRRARPPRGRPTLREMLWLPAPIWRWLARRCRRHARQPGLAVDGGDLRKSELGMVENELQSRCRGGCGPSGWPTGWINMAAGDLGCQRLPRPLSAPGSRRGQASPVPPRPQGTPVPGIADRPPRYEATLGGERPEASDAGGRPASAPAGHTPIPSASAPRPSPSAELRLDRGRAPRRARRHRVASSGRPPRSCPGHDEAWVRSAARLLVVPPDYGVTWMPPAAVRSPRQKLPPSVALLLLGVEAALTFSGSCPGCTRSAVVVVEVAIDRGRSPTP